MVKSLKTFILCCIASVAYAQPSADAIAARAVEMHGISAWSQARYFSFTIIVERDGAPVSAFPQQWDRITGNYRVSGKDPLGRPFDIVMNLGSMKGRAVLDGTPITNAGRLKDALTNVGYSRFINDVFWLLMPLRMNDPGVQKTYEGERNDSCGHLWDVLKLTFEKGGLLPGDAYWAWVNRDTGIVDEWDVRLQSMRPDARPTEIILHDFRRVAGLLLSMRKEVRGAGQVVKIENLQILPAPPKGAFD